MKTKLDATFVDAWTEFVTLREQGRIEELDEKVRHIIYIVAAAESRNENITQKGILRALKPKSSAPVTARIKELVRDGWLRAETHRHDKRTKNFYLTPKSTTMVNVLSGIVKKAVRQTAAFAAALMALLVEIDQAVTQYLTPGLGAI